jgi:hypothetical protein
MTHDFPPAPTARGRDDPRFATGTRMRPIFTATALLLAALGIYGVISDPVTRRAHELGIRIALGSPRREIGGLVLRHRMRLAAIDIAGRLVAALALARLMAGLLYGIPRPKLRCWAVALLLGGIALLRVISRRGGRRSRSCGRLRCE